MSSVITERKINTKNHKNYKVMIEAYDSAREVAMDCKERKNTDSRFHDYTKEDLSDWHGVRTYSEALDLLTNGYQPTVDKMQETLKNSVMGEAKRISFETEVAGFIPVVPLALMGIPRNMINTKMKIIKAKVVDIYYDMTCSSGTSPEDIIKAGQQVLGAIVELEKQGYKFNLYGVQSYTGNNSADILTVKIKSSNQPLDLKRISFPLTHTGFFRVIGFDWYGRCPKAKYRSGYGRAAHFEFSGDELKEFGKELFGKNAIMISANRILYRDDAKEYLKEVFTNADSKN